MTARTRTDLTRSLAQADRLLARLRRRIARAERLRRTPSAAIRIVEVGRE